MIEPLYPWPDLRIGEASEPGIIPTLRGLVKKLAVDHNPDMAGDIPVVKEREVSVDG
jgi:hypothetical protein